jgi:hypothetical protein
MTSCHFDGISRDSRSALFRDHEGLSLTMAGYLPKVWSNKLVLTGYVLILAMKIVNSRFLNWMMTERNRNAKKYSHGSGEVPLSRRRE